MLHPLHLTASMKVLPAHRRRRHVTVGDAREAIKHAAYLAGIGGDPGPETQTLTARLEKATGVSISVLAIHAEDWPDV